MALCESPLGGGGAPAQDDVQHHIDSMLEKAAMRKRQDLVANGMPLPQQPVSQHELQRRIRVSLRAAAERSGQPSSVKLSPQEELMARADAAMQGAQERAIKGGNALDAAASVSASSASASAAHQTATAQAVGATASDSATWGSPGVYSHMTSATAGSEGSPWDPTHAQGYDGSDWAAWQQASAWDMSAVPPMPGQGQVMHGNSSGSDSMWQASHSGVAGASGGDAAQDDSAWTSAAAAWNSQLMQSWATGDADDADAVGMNAQAPGMTVNDVWQQMGQQASYPSDDTSAAGSTWQTASQVLASAAPQPLVRQAQPQPSQVTRPRPLHLAGTGEQDAEEEEDNVDHLRRLLPGLSPRPSPSGSQPSSQQRKREIALCDRLPAPGTPSGLSSEVRTEQPDLLQLLQPSGATPSASASLGGLCPLSSASSTPNGVASVLHQGSYPVAAARCSTAAEAVGVKQPGHMVGPQQGRQGSEWTPWAGSPLATVVPPVRDSNLQTGTAQAQEERLKGAPTPPPDRAQQPGIQDAGAAESTTSASRGGDSAKSTEETETASDDGSELLASCWPPEAAEL
eukprot:TRINITY_DN103312_c0_g1_i1.p1 TRINITY_DN103312_c0_g1~~TRINITY_DN103312_c0_g1_i1.p1  ORF type:complete len:571 (+),score=131.27 TRINITY_DN103312_c0_g1_i1:196-1908(+)